MSHRTHPFRLWFLLSCLCLPLSAKHPAYDGTKERDAFWAYFNQKHLDGLRQQLQSLTQQLADTEPDTEARAQLQESIADTQKKLAQPEFFSFATPADLPTDLDWQDGLSEPEIGDPKAQKGGTFTSYMLSFPPTIRVLGENSNNFFRGYQYDDIEMGLTSLHPETGNVIPALAKQWAVSADSRTEIGRAHV